VSTPMPQQSPQFTALVHACATHLRGADARELRLAFEPPAQGGDEPTTEQLEVVYGAARRLCNDDNYRFAAALALHLATYRPKEPRYTFMAGICLQHVGAFANAAKFYCLALGHGGDNPAALYRLGECLLALGDKVNAEKALDAAFEASREVEGAAPLQAIAQDLLDSIRKASRQGYSPVAERSGAQR